MIRSILNRARTIEEGSRAGVEILSLRAIALIFSAMGILNMMTLFKSSIHEYLSPLEQLSPFSIQPGEPLPVALIGFLLIILADGLWRQKRTAWMIALMVLSASAISHLTEDQGFIKAISAIILGSVILFLTPRYNVRSDKPSIQKALRILTKMFVLTMIFGVAGLYFLRSNENDFNLWVSFHQSLIMFTQFYDPEVLNLTACNRYFVYLISTISAVVLGYSLFLFLQPVQINPATNQERNRARSIIETYGRSSMARLALLNDKVYFFSTGGSVVAYTVQGRFALVLGDPIGPDQDIPYAIAEFHSLCRKNDWRPAYCLTMQDYLEHYKHAGYGAMCLGHEGIIHLDNFTLTGRTNKNFRKRFNRLTKEGFLVVHYDPPISNEIINILQEVSREWLSMTGATEKRFLLGWFDDDYIRSEPLAVVYTPEGSISAFANIITEYQRNEITVDLTRRKVNSEPGTMDFLLVSLFLWAKKQGYDTFNIGLSPLYGVGHQIDASLPERLAFFVYKYGNFFYDFKGLKEFKHKFHPRWSPQFLIYPSLINLPIVWFHMVRINAGEQGSVWKYFMPKTRKKRTFLHN